MKTHVSVLLAAVVAGAAISVTTLPAAANAGTAMDAATIRKLITGKRIYLATPLGGELPLYYRTDGQVDGSGEAVGLGKFLKPSDKGRWWIQGDRLCQKWQTWYDGKTMCFTLEARGTDKVRWLRDDGDSGFARIGN